MKRVKRALLLGAVIAVVCVLAISAQNSIFLVGLGAAQTGQGGQLEIYTSGPAGFELDKGSGSLTLWSKDFSANSKLGEIPVNLDKPELKGLVDGVSMVAGSRGGGIRVYLGEFADMDAVGLAEDYRKSVLTIPVLEDQAAAWEGRESAVSAVAEDTTVAESDSLELPASEEMADSEASDPANQAGTDNSAPNSAPREPRPPRNYDLKSFEPKWTANDKAQDSGLASTPVDEVGGSFRKYRSEEAEVNYQYIPPTDKQDQPAEGGEGAPAGMEQLGNLLEQIMQEAGNAAGQSAIPAGQITTGAFNNAYQTPAELSVLTNGIQTSGGKDELKNIAIDLFEIVNTPLDQAITLLVAPTDYNVIVDSSVGENSVSLSFKEKQTDLKSAMDLITKVYALDYVVQANTIVVASKDKMAGNLVEFIPRLFVLSYADPLSVKDMLINTGLCGENQVEIYNGEINYPEVNDSTFLSTESGSETTEIKPIETNLSSTPRNAILVKAVPEDMLMIAKVIAEVDRQPKIIELEVRVCEAGESALRDLGIEVNNNASTPSPTGTVWTEQPQATYPDGNGGLDPHTIENFGIEAWTAGSFYRSPLQFIATLNTQIQEGKVELLAQPTLTTVEGKQAIYFAGERLPYIARVSTAPTGQTQIEVDFLNVGVTLNFKPRLDADGKLTIDVNPIVSSLLEFRIIGGLVEAPRTSSRQTATTVRVADREPFVLSGLITETERTTITKIPMLGDLPMVGKLFRNKDKKGERTEIIIVVTPIIHE